MIRDLEINKKNIKQAKEDGWQDGFVFGFLSTIILMSASFIINDYNVVFFGTIATQSLFLTLKLLVKKE